MKRTHLALACFLINATAFAELQLTPTLATYEVEGLTFAKLAFQDGAKVVTYCPPVGWDNFGSNLKLTLRPRAKPQAEATVSRHSPVASLPRDEEAMRRLVNEALASAPPNSTDVQLLSQEKTPVAISGRETFLVTISYHLYGLLYGRSVMFLNREHDQICFQLASPMADFKELQQAFLRSHFTWQNL